MQKMSNWIYYFIVSLPLIDLITSIISRNYLLPLSFGTIVKGLLVLFFCYYIIFKSKSKFQKVSKTYLIILLIYVILYFLFKPDLLNIKYLLTEINYLFKFMFFPIIFFGLINYFDNEGFDIRKLTYSLIINLLLYCLLILIAVLTNTNYDSYSTGYLGTIGWYFSANEISTILIILFPFIYKLFDKNKNKYGFLVIFPVIYIISLIGTKVSWFGLLIIGLIMFLYMITKEKKIYNKNVIFSLVVFLFMIISTFNCNALLNLNDLHKNSAIPVEDINYCYYAVNSNTYLSKLTFLLSGRNEYLINTMHIFENKYQIGYNYFGMGFSNTNRVSDFKINKLIEMDFFDIYYHLGFCALILLIFPFYYLLYSYIKSKKYRAFNLNNALYMLIISLTIVISNITGHVYLAPSVSFYIVCYFILIFDEWKLIKSNDKV